MGIAASCKVEQGDFFGLEPNSKSWIEGVTYFLLRLDIKIVNLVIYVIFISHLIPLWKARITNRLDPHNFTCLWKANVKKKFPK